METTCVCKHLKNEHQHHLYGSQPCMHVIRYVDAPEIKCTCADFKEQEHGYFVPVTPWNDSSPSSSSHSSDDDDDTSSSGSFGGGFSGGDSGGSFGGFGGGDSGGGGASGGW